MVHPFEAYFAADATADQLVPVEGGAVTQMATLWRGAAIAGGFFDPGIFGPLDGSEPRWGRLDVASGIVIAGTRVMRIPVPPIAMRPPIVVGDPAARALWHGPINAAWIDLLGAIRIHDRLAGLAPEAFIANQAAHVQRHFEDVVALMRGERPAPHHAHDQTDVDGYLMMPCAPVEPAQPLALLFLDDDRLLVQTTAGCRVVDRTGAVRQAWSPTGPFASSVHGDLVVFNAGQRSAWRCACYADAAWPDDASRSLPLAAYDLAARRWLMLADDRLPAWAIDETDVRDADALDLRADEAHALTAPGLDAKQLVQSRDGRFALVRLARLSMNGDEDAEVDDDANPVAQNDAVDMVHALIEISTQRPFVELTDSPLDLRAELHDLAQDQHPFSPRPAAIAYTAERGWRIVDPTGAVGDGTRWFYRLKGLGPCAWSPDATQLATLIDDRVVFVTITPEGAQIG